MADAYGNTSSEMEGKSDTDFMNSNSKSTMFRENDMKIISGELERLDVEETFTDNEGKTRIHNIKKYHIACIS